MKLDDKIIDIVASNPDWKALGIYVAKNHPRIFVTAFKKSPHRRSVLELIDEIKKSRSL